MAKRPPFAYHPTLRTFAAIVAATVLLLANFPTTLAARTWHIQVDGLGDAPTIQAGIDRQLDSAMKLDSTRAAVGRSRLPGGGEVEPFSMVVNVGESDLWVGGHQLSGSVELNFDGLVLHVGEVAVDFEPHDYRSAEELDEGLLLGMTEVPLIQECLAKGMSKQSAADALNRALGELQSTAVSRFASDGMLAALQFLEESPMVAEADVDGGSHLKYRLRGLNFFNSFNASPSNLNWENGPHNADRVATQRMRKAENLASWIESGLRSAPPGGRMILVSRAGNYFSTGGDGRQAISDQIELLRTGASWETVAGVPGGLSIQSEVLREIKLTLEAKDN